LRSCRRTSAGCLRRARMQTRVSREMFATLDAAQQFRTGIISVRSCQVNIQGLHAHPKADDIRTVSCRRVGVRGRAVKGASGGAGARGALAAGAWQGTAGGGVASFSQPRVYNKRPPPDDALIFAAALASKVSSAIELQPWAGRETTVAPRRRKQKRVWGRGGL
jgi:hypothetical protein